MIGSAMQSGDLNTRTENQMKISENKTHQKIQQQIFNMNAHSFVAFTSASAEISSWQAAVWPLSAASCRAVHWSLEQKIRWKYRKTKHNKNSATNFEHECAPVCRIHVSFRWNQQLASCRVTITGSVMQSGALVTRTENQMKISKNKTHQKFSNKFWTWMRTSLSHSHQLPLKSAAGKLPCDHVQQRNAERCIAN
jgi:hypothetical protein